MISCQFFQSRFSISMAIGDPIVEEQSLRKLLRLTGKGESDEVQRSGSSRPHSTDRGGPN